ncbi:hypothetical protein EON67_11085 [archaeon]|nr:MAG: hypothetical protein EON67_11085 [archaeon]
MFMKELRRDLQEGGVPLAVPMAPAAPAGAAAVSAALTAPVVTAPALVAPILPVPSSDRQEAWLAVGIVVKVVNKKVADGKYYKLKGNVTAVTDDFIATVRMHDSGDVLQLDQDDCETVIPAEGGIVRVVNGAYRGHLGRVVAILTEAYTTTLSLISGVYKGATVPGFEYEDVCRVTDDVASAYASA